MNASEQVPLLPYYLPKSLFTEAKGGATEAATRGARHTRSSH